MYGKDVERLISCISDVLKSGTRILESISQDNDPIETSWVEHTSGSHRHTEEKNNKSVKLSINSDEFLDEFPTVQRIKSRMYVSENEYNNSAGSPFTELDELKNAIDRCSKLPVDCVNARISSMGKIYQLLSAANAAKFAVILYHEFIQQAYDNLNGVAPEK